MARGTRTRVEDGIYRDASGLAAVVTVNRRRREKRFAPTRELADLRLWRAETVVDLLKTTPRLISDRRTFARDVARYLRTRKGRPSYRSDRSHFKPWVKAFGSRERHELTREELQREIATWTTTSPRTIRHRVRVLRELFETLDPDWPHPVRKLKLPRVARSVPTPLSHELLKRVANSLVAGKSARGGHGWEPVKSRARFFVYALCGQRPAQIGRAQPSDVDLERRIWWVRPAKGGDPIPLPLSDQMVAAWQTFIAAEAWGTFDTTSFARVLRRHGWPKGIRPYQLRHTFAIDLLLADVPLETLQGLLGHLNITTTRIYAPVQLARMQSAIGKRTLALDPARATRGVPRERARSRSFPKLREGSASGTRTEKKAAS